MIDENNEREFAPVLGGIEYRKTSDLFADSQAIIDEARGVAQTAVNVALVRRNWLLGRSIAEEDLDGAERADYGARTIKELAKKLTERNGRGSRGAIFTASRASTRPSQRFCRRRLQNLVVCSHGHTTSSFFASQIPTPVRGTSARQVSRDGASKLFSVTSIPFIMSVFSCHRSKSRSSGRCKRRRPSSSRNASNS